MLIFLISLIGIQYYFNNHKEELTVQIEKLLNERSNGEILFDSINISSLREFPSVKINIFNLSIVDSLYAQHKRKTIFIEEVSASLSVIDVLNEEVKIKSVSAKKGYINIYVDEDHFSNSYVFKTKPSKKEKELNLKIIDDDIAFLMEDIEFTFKEKIKNKRITAHVNKVDFNIDLKKLIIPKLNLDVFMKEMGLNLDNGTFFNNVRCVGSFQPIINTSGKTINVPEFLLKIGEQNFDVSAFINLNNKNFNFLLSLKDANYNNSLHLLPNNIKHKLERFEIKKSFKVSAAISGKFVYKDNTLVNLKYETSNNEIFYKKDSLYFKNISFNGSTKNRAFKDSTKVENRKNLTNSFDFLSGDYNNIPFKIKDLILVSEFSKPSHLTTDYEGEGEIKHLNTIINSSDYNFSNGTFKLVGNYDGTINSISDIINSSEVNIKSKRLIINSKHNENQYNIPKLELYIDHNNAEIKELIVDLDTKENIKIKGDIKNFGSLLSNDITNQTTYSTIDISSNYLNYQSLLKSFGAHEKQSQSKNISQTKQSINILASKFNPKLSFYLKQLEFLDVSFNDITIDAQYQDNHVLIKEISGNYKGGNAIAKIKFDLNPRKNDKDEETLQMDLILNANGKIEHWAEILNYDKFYFNDADYKLNVLFNNEASNIKELINNSEITLNVNEGSMLYKPANLTLPFNNISISIKNKNAFLNDFELSLPDHQAIHLNGEIENFMEVFDKSIFTKNVNSSITITSKNLNFSNFIDTFNPVSQKSSNQNNIKLILKELHSKYNPTLKLNLEKLNYNNITLENVNASLFFNGINTLNLDNAYCFFYDKKISIDAEIDISHHNQTPFKTNFKLDDFALENLFYTFHNFGYDQLEKPTELTGVINLNASFRGLIDDSSGVIYDSLEAELSYNIKELNINNFKPIMDAGNIVFRKKRFEEIKFANITSTLYLKNNIISIPETNVQSTAFDFFIEGDIANTSFTDLWISIPLSNFKKRDLTKAPPKVSFDEAGRKIYLEVTSKEEGELDYKVHLSEKKRRKTSN